MKNKILAIIIVLIITSSLGRAAPETKEEAAVKKALSTLLKETAEQLALSVKWEYKCLTLESLLKASSPSDLLGSDKGIHVKTEKALRELGNQRWELVHINERGYTFKRPVKK